MNARDKDEPASSGVSMVLGSPRCMGVVGAGQMGAGIAAALVRAGLEDRDSQPERGDARARAGNASRTRWLAKAAGGSCLLSSPTMPVPDCKPPPALRSCRLAT